MIKSTPTIKMTQTVKTCFCGCQHAEVFREYAVKQDGSSRLISEEDYCPDCRDEEIERENEMHGAE